MMKKWKVIEEENIADLTVEVLGDNKKDLLNNVITVFASLITDVDKLKETEQLKNVEIKGENFEVIIFNFVEKLIYFKDAQFLLFKKGEFKVGNKKIIANLFGQKITNELPIKIDIKALTKHKFKVRKNKFYKVFMVFDI
ncbi:MAG: archease [Microgenomates group bacterium]